MTDESSRTGIHMPRQLRMLYKLTNWWLGYRRWSDGTDSGDVLLQMSIEPTSVRLTAETGLPSD